MKKLFLSIFFIPLMIMAEITQHKQDLDAFCEKEDYEIASLAALHHSAGTNDESKAAFNLTSSVMLGISDLIVRSLPYKIKAKQKKALSSLFLKLEEKKIIIKKRFFGLLLSLNQEQLLDFCQQATDFFDNSSPSIKNTASFTTMMRSLL